MFTTVSSNSKVIGYWMFSAEAKQLTTAKAQALKSKGITDIYVCTRDVNGNYHLSELQNAITLLHKQGIRVHAWIICFKDDSWVNPSSSSYQSKLISKIKSIVIILAYFMIFFLIGKAAKNRMFKLGTIV